MTDHGLVVGDGVFEALKVTPAGAFAVQRHLNRMTRSAAAMGLPDPDHGLVREGIAAALDGWPTARGKVRVTYTGRRRSARLAEPRTGRRTSSSPSNLVTRSPPRRPS